MPRTNQQKDRRLTPRSGLSNLLNIVQMSSVEASDRLAPGAAPGAEFFQGEAKHDCSPGTLSRFAEISAAAPPAADHADEAAIAGARALALYRMKRGPAPDNGTSSHCTSGSPW